MKSLLSSPPTRVAEIFDSLVTDIFRLIHMYGAIHEVTASLLTVLPHGDGALVGLGDLHILTDITSQRS